MNFDIVIIGGGQVGASLACALNNSTLKVGLVDANPQASLDDSRLIALNYGSIHFLKSLNVFEQLQSMASMINEVQVSKKGRFGTVRITAKETKLPFLGYVVPAKTINTALENSLQNTHIERIYPARLTALSDVNTGIQLTLQRPSGESLNINTNILIAADGTHSTIRELLSIPITTHDYRQSAIVSTISLARAHKQIAYERFVANGAIAMLPLTENRVAMIWSADQTKIDFLIALNDQDFLQQLQTEFGFKLGHLKSIAPRSVFPLKYIKIPKRVYGHTILLGNAAHTLHPLAAQGLNLALQEVKLLSQIILSSTSDKIDFQSFEKYSLSDLLTLEFSGYLNSLFATDSSFINLARQLGMIGLNISGIKRQMALLLAGVSKTY